MAARRGYDPRTFGSEPNALPITLTSKNYGAIVIVITVGAPGTLGTETDAGTEGAEFAPACTVSTS